MKHADYFSHDTVGIWFEVIYFTEYPIYSCAWRAYNCLIPPNIIYFKHIDQLERHGILKGFKKQVCSIAGYEDSISLDRAKVAPVELLLVSVVA
jgi:hypothetical protein